jgi:hypothetical protein
MIHGDVGKGRQKWPEVKEKKVGTAFFPGHRRAF